MFKYILKEASHPALVQWINGLFGKHYPPESPVTFEATESVTEQDEKLGHIFSDMLLTIGTGREKAAFHIEAQIGDDEALAIRVFQYGFGYARQYKQVSKNKRLITLAMPDARIIFWESTRTTPDVVTLRLQFPDGSHHDYQVRTFKVLEHSLETLEQRNMALLLPFYLLKFRKAVTKPGTTGEERRELAAKTRELLKELEDIVERSRAQGIISDSDAAMIMERVVRMHDELYKTYPEFEEVAMELEERLKTHWQEYQAKGEQIGEWKAEENIRQLLKQGYSVEQLTAFLDSRASKRQNTPRVQS